MIRGLQGNMITQHISAEPYKAFVPFDLPPDPPLAIDAQIQDLLDKANRAIGRLDGAGMVLPDISLFIYFYVRKEAILSSQIEGTQSSLSDLLVYENESSTNGLPLDDVQEVSNYVQALDYGLAKIRSGAPLTSRLLREVHAVLLSRGRGSDQQPGEYRRSQNWLGGKNPGNARYVPPPAGEVAACMAQLEKFIHDKPSRTPTLIKAALTHVQFETIHPFLDGNGRTGRLLIPLLLCYENALHDPLLYLSLYFKANRTEYYDLLQKTRISGSWEEWLVFFLEGVQTTADQAATTAQRIIKLFTDDQTTIHKRGRSGMSASRLHHLLQNKPIISIATAAHELGISRPTVVQAIDLLQELGVIRERSGRQRDKRYAYEAYLTILEEGTEPLPR